MKKIGQITSIIIALIIVTFFEFIELLFLGEFLKREIIIDLLIVVPLFWFIGKQYDKMKFYMDRMNESEKNYKQLIETIPDAIMIHYQDMIIYVNEAGKNMLGAEKKEDILGKSIYDFVKLRYQELAKKRMEQLRKEKKATNNAEQKLVRLDNKI